MSRSFLPLDVMKTFFSESAHVQLMYASYVQPPFGMFALHSTVRRRRFSYAVRRSRRWSRIDRHRPVHGGQSRGIRAFNVIAVDGPLARRISTTFATDFFRTSRKFIQLLRCDRMASARVYGWPIDVLRPARSGVDLREQLVGSGTAVG
jgi:hypothetical protein